MRSHKRCVLKDSLTIWCSNQISDYHRRLPCVKGTVSEADRGIVLMQILIFYNPSVSLTRATSLCTREALGSPVSAHLLTTNVVCDKITTPPRATSWLLSAVNLFSFSQRKRQAFRYLQPLLSNPFQTVYSLICLLNRNDKQMLQHIPRSYGYGKAQDQQ